MNDSIKPNWDGLLRYWTVRFIFEDITFKTNVVATNPQVAAKRGLLNYTTYAPLTERRRRGAVPEAVVTRGPIYTASLP